MHFLQERVDLLHQAGVKDIIIDPGFGFGKTLEENYLLLREMNVLHALHCPIMAGLSRKSMLFKALNTDPAHALNATTAANMLALTNGADILRVHDVKEAAETITIHRLCLTSQ
jgi:dihydropteroate synthase